MANRGGDVLSNPRKEGPAAFVMPFYGDQHHSARYLREAIQGLQAQTDENWCLVIVDDATPKGEATDELYRQCSSESRIHLIEFSVNQGHGVARNAATALA